MHISKPYSRKFRRGLPPLIDPGPPEMAKSRRAMVTGLGAVSTQGRSMDAQLQAIRNNALAGAKVPSLAAAGVPVQHAGQVPLSEQPGKGKGNSHAMSPASHFACTAAADAVHDAVLYEPPDAVSVGCGMGQPGALADAGVALHNGTAKRSVGPRFSAAVLPNAPASAVALAHGVRGSCLAPSTACAAGAHAIRDAILMITAGEADRVLAGGAEACIEPVSMLAFARSRALSPTGVSRPFDQQRDGFLLSEGAAMLLIESEASANARGIVSPYAEIVSTGSTCDAYHEMAPSPSGEGAARAMEMAISNMHGRGVSVNAGEYVEYVNCHAAGTPAGDTAEGKAIARVFDSTQRPQPKIGSFKGTLGHMLGAAGAAETALTCYALHHHLLPGTPGLSQLDTSSFASDDIMVQQSTVDDSPITLALCNSFGFGGTNACILLRRR